MLRMVLDARRISPDDRPLMPDYQELAGSASRRGRGG